MKMTTTAKLMQFVSKYLDRLTNENLLNNSDAESLRQQIKHLSFMVSIGINRTLEEVELLIENQRTIMDDIDCGFITWKNLSYFNDWELKVLKMINKVEKDENIENVKIEPDYEGYEDYAGWMDGGKMDQKSDPDFDSGDPVLISLVKKNKVRTKGKGRYIKKAPGERKQRILKSFVWKHFTVSSDPEDPNSGKQCLCRHCGKTIVMYGSCTSQLREHLLKQHNDEVDPEDKVEKQRVGSFVWNHFTKDMATGNCECQHCGMTITTTSGGTTKLRDHIKKYHPEKYDETATTPYIRAGATAAEDPGEPQYIMDPESGEMMTEKEYKKKHRKFRKDKGKEMKKRSIVWNFFHKDPEDKTKTICQICFQVLLFSGSNGSMLSHLRHHKVLQEDDVEIPCSECGKLLKNKAALKRHEKIAHFDTDRFVCSYCPKAFCSNSRRLIHERIHTGEKPYQVHCTLIGAFNMEKKSI